MKRVLLFVVIISILGSLKKPDVVTPCTKEVRSIFYLNRKVVHVDIGKQPYSSWGDPVKANCNAHRYKIEYSYDSVTYQMK